MLSPSDDDDDIDASRLTTTEYACAERGMQVMILAEFCVPARPTLETGSDCESDDDEYIDTLTKRRRVEDPMWLPFAIAVDNQIRSWGHHAHKKPSTPEIESIWDIPSGEFKLKVDCTRTAWQHMSDELHKLPAHIKVRYRKKPLPRSFCLFLMVLRWKVTCGLRWVDMATYLGHHFNHLAAWYCDIIEVVKNSVYLRISTHIDVNRFGKKSAMKRMMNGMDDAGSMITGLVNIYDGKAFGSSRPSPRAAEKRGIPRSVEVDRLFFSNHKKIHGLNANAICWADGTTQMRVHNINTGVSCCVCTSDRPLSAHLVSLSARQ